MKESISHVSPGSCTNPSIGRHQRSNASTSPRRMHSDELSTSGYGAAGVGKNVSARSQASSSSTTHVVGQRSSENSSAHRLHASASPRHGKRTSHDHVEHLEVAKINSLDSRTSSSSDRIAFGPRRSSVSPRRRQFDVSGAAGILRPVDHRPSDASDVSSCDGIQQPSLVFGSASTISSLPPASPRTKNCPKSPSGSPARGHAAMTEKDVEDARYWEAFEKGRVHDRRNRLSKALENRKGYAKETRDAENAYRLARAQEELRQAVHEDRVVSAKLKAIKEEAAAIRNDKFGVVAFNKDFLDCDVAAEASTKLRGWRRDTVQRDVDAAALRMATATTQLQKAWRGHAARKKIHRHRGQQEAQTEKGSWRRHYGVRDQRGYHACPWRPSDAPRKAGSESPHKCRSQSPRKSPHSSPRSSAARNDFPASASAQHVKVGFSPPSSETETAHSNLKDAHQRLRIRRNLDMAAKELNAQDSLRPLLNSIVGNAR